MFDHGENGLAHASQVIKLAAKQKLKREELGSGKGTLIKRSGRHGGILYQEIRCEVGGL